MEFEHLYLLSDADLRGALHVRPQEKIEDQFALLRGEVKPKVPIVFVRSMGKNPMDLISTEYPALYLFSDRVLSYSEVMDLLVGILTQWKSMIKMEN